MMCFAFLSQAVVIAQPTPQEVEVIATLSNLFDGIKNGDTSLVKAVFHPYARMFSIRVDGDAQSATSKIEVDRFVAAVGAKGEAKWEEKIWSYDIRIDGPLATAWTEYSFFRNDQLSHCGVNAFQLVRNEDAWKIIQVIDTRRSTACRQNPVEDKLEINQLLDAWHQAAARADESTFFEALAIDAIYLGTDENEYWRKGAFHQWAKPYFEQGKTWDFKPVERHVYISSDGQFAWFDEKLDTWMGPCRGSGVVEKTPAGWKIKHYNLAVTVPNALMNDYIELLKGHTPDKK